MITSVIADAITAAVTDAITAAVTDAITAAITDVITAAVTDAITMMIAVGTLVRLRCGSAGADGLSRPVTARRWRGSMPQAGRAAVRGAAAIPAICAHAHTHTHTHKRG